MSHLDEKSVGSYFTDDSGRLWRLIAYSDGPSVTFEAVTPENSNLREMVGGVVGSPFVNRFHRLVPEP